MSPDDQKLGRFIEELSVNAWPALQTVCYDGWLLRFAAGYTRRANSVHPLYPSSVDVVEKIRHCERLYASQGQRSLFKMTPFSQPEGLDGVLVAHGYAREAGTSVQVLRLDDVTPARHETVLVDTDLSERWLADYCRLNDVDVRHAPTMATMLVGLIPAHGFFSIRRASETIAVGLAVVERGWVGLFDIVVAPHLRNQGLGMGLVLQMLSWGRSNGAADAYLQVMLTNTPAIRLYGKLGFREKYTYWYRTRMVNCEW